MRNPLPRCRIAEFHPIESPPARVANTCSRAKCADHTQVRDDGQAPTRVRVDELGHGQPRALLDLSQAFTTAGAHVEIPGVEALQHIAGRARDLVARQALPVAEVEFAPLRVQLGSETPRLPEDRGRLRGAAQIARDDHVDGFAGEFARERVRLLEAASGERRISVPLPAARRVPARLGVSDQQQGRPAHDSIAVRDQRPLSPASGSANTSPARIGVRQ